MEEIKVIFENENFLVLDKSAGWVVTNENSRGVNTVETWLEATERGTGLKRRGIVHRLDKGTSGLLLVARTKEYEVYLRSLFKERQIGKTYIALVSGEISSDGTVEMPIGRSRRHFSRFEVREDGKKSETRFQRVAVINFLGKKYSLVRVDLKTGRTHQIRVHFRFLGWPLVGDKLYGGGDLPGLTRPFLHAAEIKWTDMGGNPVHFESKLPKDLVNLLVKMGYEHQG